MTGVTVTKTAKDTEAGKGAASGRDGASRKGAATETADGGDDEIRMHVIVTGLVQGVGFRYFTVMQARGIGVGGWVRNLNDGSVEVEVQGGRLAVAKLLSWLKVGPKWAHVESIDARPLPPIPSRHDRFRVFNER
ncbi:acylphosphatase [Bifidobacterium jacchi]|uniref:Acylphosphatase n=2 Tax=Bifidobacterium jacchi TaxID=2490545 RepID=A0A5N5RIG0_9BIFI|nr:acylphosphatase [Bifidobacterium jacchi]